MSGKPGFNGDFSGLFIKIDPIRKHRIWENWFIFTAHNGSFVKVGCEKLVLFINRIPFVWASSFKKLKPKGMRGSERKVIFERSQRVFWLEIKNLKMSESFMALITCRNTPGVLVKLGFGLFGLFSFGFWQVRLAPFTDMNWEIFWSGLKFR